MGGLSTQCYLGIFQSKEIEQDTWYLGNILMEDYYVVYDATPADEQGLDYIQLGLARSVDTLIYQEGAEVNIFEKVEIDNPIANGEEEDQGEATHDNKLLIILLIATLCVVGVVGGLYCVKGKKNNQ